MNARDDGAQWRNPKCRRREVATKISVCKLVLKNLKGLNATTGSQ